MDIETSAPAPVESTPTESSTDFSPSAADTADSAVLTVDEETGERKVEYGKGLPAEREPPQENSNYYNQNDFMNAIQSGTLDVNRVSPEQRQMVNNIANAYAQQQQAIAQQQERMAEANRLQSQSDAEALAKMTEEARKEAAKALNIDAEDIDALEYMENGDELKAKLEEQTRQMMMERQREFYRQRFESEKQLGEFQNNLNQIAGFCRAEKANEPEFETILKTMDENMENMPYKIGARLKLAEQNIQQGKCTKEDLEMFQNAYNDAKKAIYQQKYGVTNIPQRTNVPVVERSGAAGADIRGIDLKAFNGASTHDRAAMVQDWIAKQL